MGFRKRFLKCISRENKVGFLEDNTNLNNIRNIESMSNDEIDSFLVENADGEDVDFFVWEMVECDDLSNELVKMGYAPLCESNSPHHCEECAKLCVDLWNEECGDGCKVICEQGNSAMTNFEYYKDRLFNIFPCQRALGFPGGDCESGAASRCKECKEKFINWLCEEHQEPEIDWAAVPVNTPVLVRNAEVDFWEQKNFIMYAPSTKMPFLTFNDSFTSETANMLFNNSIMYWAECRLANEEDVEKYKKKV